MPQTIFAGLVLAGLLIPLCALALVSPNPNTEQQSITSFQTVFLNDFSVVAMLPLCDPVLHPTDKGNPPGKLADAELHFSGVPGRPAAHGLRCLGTQGRREDVTLLARQCSVNGERRSFALLRPEKNAASQERLRA